MNSIKLFFLLILYFPVFVFAQKSNSAKMVIEYNYVTPAKTEQQLEESIKKVKEILPEGDTREKIIALKISDNKPSIFRKKLVFDNERAFYTDETMKKYPLKVGEYNVFFDMEKKEYIAQSYIFNKPFIVEKEVIELDWTYSNETKQIGAFKAKKAIAKKDTIFFAEVWYTDDLAAFPLEGLYGVKGGIVEATFAEGQKLILKNFTTALSEEDIIEKPSKGKNISEKEFKLLEIQKTKEVNEGAKNRIKN